MHVVIARYKVKIEIYSLSDYISAVVFYINYSSLINLYVFLTSDIYVATYVAGSICSYHYARGHIFNTILNTTQCTLKLSYVTVSAKTVLNGTFIITRKTDLKYSSCCSSVVLDFSLARLTV